ncbi:MAG: hypothetical protein PHR00_02400 [Patescibacteria group bacterium]|nr:hypothetical protein [Patescibacteria group bacterium]
MSIIESKLQSLLDGEINLTQTHVMQGSTSHTYIRNLLANRRRTDSSFPWLLDGDFLTGSYARGTKLHPLDDIDVMIVLDGAGLVPTGIEDTHYVEGNTDGIHSPIHNHINQDNTLDSHAVLHAFHKTLNQSHPESKIKKDGQSVNVQLKSSNLGIDIVPCFHIIPFEIGQQDFYYIPMGNNNPSWLKTNPKIDQNISKNLHDRHNKKLKSVIKLVKYWNRIKNNERLRSYHLETIAWYVFHNHPSAIATISDGVRYFFSHANDYLVGQLYEATGFGGMVDSYLSSDDRQLSINAVDSAKKALQPQALLPSLNAQAGYWQSVFGDKF